MEKENPMANPKYDRGDRIIYVGGGEPYINGTVESLSDTLHGCTYYIIQTEAGRFDVPEKHLKPR